MSYWSSFLGLVRNRRATSEYLEAPEIAGELANIKELYSEELKEKKKEQKKLDKQDDETLPPAPPEAEEEEEDETEAALKHMLIEGAPALPFKTEIKGERMVKMKDTLLTFKKVAQRKVPSLQFNGVTLQLRSATTSSSSRSPSPRTISLTSTCRRGSRTTRVSGSLADAGAQLVETQAESASWRGTLLHGMPDDRV